MDSARRQLLVALTLLPAGGASLAATPMTRGLSIPSGYARIASACRVPAALLYGVALQESQMTIGESRAREPRPWPWTLNVAGTPARFDTRARAEQRLRTCLRIGVDNVDIGPMGINWRYHKMRLVSVERSLDPYWNLRVGAALLAEHFADCGDWAEAVGRYHSPANKARAATYSASVFARLRRLSHA